MSWLRLDDGFTEHPKLAGFTVAQKWAWLEVLTYCARRETDGLIPDVSVLPRNVTAALLARAADAGLIDVDADGNRRVHDWREYNPPRQLDELVLEYLEANPNASANDVAKHLGGNRNRILKLVRRYRAGNNPVSNPGITEGAKTAEVVSKSGIARGRAGAYPNPYPVRTSNTETEPAPAPVATDQRNGDTGAGAGAEHEHAGTLDRLDPRAELDRLTRQPDDGT